MEKNNNPIPKHIVLFPDGNRRWAREKGLDPLEGHREGYENLVRFCEWCQKKGVKVVTAFGFSTENWNRTQREVSYLMRLLEKGLVEHFKKYAQDPQYKELKVRVRVIGQRERLPKSLQRVIHEIEQGTKGNDKFLLNLAISYGGRWDIVQAAKKIVDSGVASKDITEDMFSKYLSTVGFADPDLVIRAGGEKRFSNFVLWQAAYTELYFIDKYWPDFKEQDFNEALEEYARRQRRFGK